MNVVHVDGGDELVELIFDFLSAPEEIEDPDEDDIVISFVMEDERVVVARIDEDGFSDISCDCSDLDYDSLEMFVERLLDKELPFGTTVTSGGDDSGNSRGRDVEDDDDDDDDVLDDEDDEVDEDSVIQISLIWEIS